MRRGVALRCWKRTAEFTCGPGAVERVLRVPAGFMRNRTQDRIEELAAERSVTEIDLEIVEDGIEIGRQMMAQMITNYEANPEAARKELADSDGNGERTGDGGNGRKVETFATDITRETGPALNEAGLMGGAVPPKPQSE